MTLRQFTSIFTDVAITAKIIQAEEQELEFFCDTACWLKRFVFANLFIYSCILDYLKEQVPSFNYGINSKSQIQNLPVSALRYGENQKLFDCKLCYFCTLTTIVYIIITFGLIQSELAHFCVPIVVFGTKSLSAIAIWILICVSVLFHPCTDIADQSLVGIGKPDLVLYWNTICILIFSGVLLIEVQRQFIGVAASRFLVH